MEVLFKAHKEYWFNDCLLRERRCQKSVFSLPRPKKYNIFIVYGMCTRYIHYDKFNELAGLVSGH